MIVIINQETSTDDKIVSQYEMGYLRILKILPHKMFFNYKGEKNNFAMEMPDRCLFN